MFGLILEHGATHIFETVQVLVALSARLALERLLLFHAHGSWVRSTCLWIYNGEGAVLILMQPLGGVPVRLVVSEE